MVNLRDLSSGRRNFIRQLSLAATSLTLPAISLAGKTGNNMKLSFSTLGCPDWPLKKILSFGKQNNYQGLEIRVIQRELNLPACPDFSRSNISLTKRMISDHGLVITNLGSSAQMHFIDKVLSEKNIDECKRFIELASDLNCPYIRVFPEKIPNDISKEKTLEAIVNNLRKANDYAKQMNVRILMETHGDLVKTDDILKVMTAAPESVGLIWDFYNMWSKTRESPLFMYQHLKPYIKHVHLKDAVQDSVNEKYVLIGRGEACVKEVVSLLYKNNYEGFYSFEWEKMWHTDIEEPDVALAHFPIAMQAYQKTF